MLTFFDNSLFINPTLFKTIASMSLHYYKEIYLATLALLNVDGFITICRALRREKMEMGQITVKLPAFVSSFNSNFI